jgi:hypothetical protein
MILIDVLANDVDVDGDNLQIVSITEPEYGLVASIGDTIRYTPTAPHSGLDQFAYTISDGHGGESTAQVSVQRSANEQYLPQIGSD